MSAALVTLNGVEVFASVGEVKGGWLRIQLDAGDWRGLGLRPGDRVRVQRDTRTGCKTPVDATLAA